MKKAFKKISFALFSAAILFNFAACSSGDGDSSGSGSGLEIPPATPVTLPESSGENPFKGKTLTVDRGYESSHTKTYKFNDNGTSVDVNETYNGVLESTTSYTYTYDADKSLIYLGLTKLKTYYGSQSESWSSTSEYISKLKQYGENPTEYDVAMMNNDFSLPRTYKYKISGSAIELDTYFNGQLPTNEDFTFYDFMSGVSINLYENQLLITISGNDYIYDGYPTYNAGSFEVVIFKSLKNDDKPKYTKLGTIKGTYKTEGTGTENCKIILTFTEMPEELSSYKDKEVTLSN